MKLFIIALSSLVFASGCTEQLRRAGIDERQLQAVGGVASTLARAETTPAEEAQLGQAAAATLLGTAPLVTDREMMQYINQLGGWIAKQTGRSDINWRFGVINSSNVNAFAAPDGYVFVTKGLLRELRDESELAGVVAHEIAHVVKRHYVVAMRKKDTTNALTNLAATTAQRNTRNADIVAQPLANLAQNLYSSGLDKGDEYEADRLGVVYAARAGYDPYGLVRVIAMYAGNSSNHDFELLFSTHPAPQDRLSALDKTMGDRLDAFESKSISDSKSFQRMKQKAIRLADPKN